MKKRLKQLEISVSDLADIRLLVKTLRQVLSLAGRDPADVMLVYVTVEDRVPGEEETLRQVLYLAGRDPAEMMLVYVTVEDRVPGEEVRIIFQEYPEILEEFLKALEDQGRKVTCEDLIPGIVP